MGKSERVNNKKKIKKEKKKYKSLWHLTIIIIIIINKVGWVAIYGSAERICLLLLKMYLKGPSHPPPFIIPVVPSAE